MAQFISIAGGSLTENGVSTGVIETKAPSKRYAAKRRRRRTRNRQRRAKRLAWLEHRNIKSLRRRTRKKRRRTGFTPKPVFPAFNQHTSRSVKSAADGKLIIDLPEIMDFEEQYETTASHLAVLRKAVHAGRPISSLNFGKIRHVSPSAALVLASEVDRWNQKMRGRLRANVRTWDPDIERLLCQMGYFELLGLKHPSTVMASKNTTFLPFKRGEVQNHDGGQLAKQLRIEVENLVGVPIKKQFLFEGLSEAITNVAQHAYGTTSGVTVHQWWLSASFDRDTERLCVMFFDQGDGIPTTLPRAHFFAAIRDYLHAWPDSRKIKAAMETGRSSTGAVGRGKGLQNLVEFARQHKEGRLSIYSLCGRYRCDFGVDDDRWSIGFSRGGRISLRDHETSIGGTLIEWSVIL